MNLDINKCAQACVVSPIVFSMSIMLACKAAGTTAFIPVGAIEAIYDIHLSELSSLSSTPPPL